ncbi:MAG: PEP-CTERM sorting domain-containing protein [Hydrococcus sp. RU_2_2]|nr:PEP-CTERM sorting domain-containing protein [Hydrococcus sp. RU_2_2]NJP21629.1 PEP-CTERM sorting domain-containing protein [Hydrococcus sp. CRU_1_1]
MVNPISKLGFGLSLTLLTVLAPVQPTFAETTSVRPDYERYYIGLDGREFVTYGTYTGLANPNYNRLTFLFPHLEEDPTNNHFHGIGTYSYTGSLDNPTVIPTDTNNRIPEYWTGLSPIKLLPGTGVFANQLISQKTDEEYTNWTISPVQSLLNYPNELPAEYLYNSSEGDWQRSLGEAEIALELVSITPGLGIADSMGVDLFNSVGDRYVIGRGDNFSFEPTFYTSKSAPLGQYSAEFRLVDVNTANNRTPLATSGTFIVDFQVRSVPESSTFLGFGLLGVLGLVSQGKKKSK